MVKEMKRKLFVCLLALVLIVTLMPAAAFAENTRGSGDSIEVDGPTPEIDPTTGVTFTVFKFEWVDDEVCPLADAVFTLTDVADRSKVYGPKTSGENGEAIFNNIPDGTYELRETRAPEGYWRNPLPITLKVENGVVKEVYPEWEYTYDEGEKIEFLNYKLKQKTIKINLEKKVEKAGTQVADENKEFKARLNFVRFSAGEATILESYDTTFKAGDKFLKFEILDNCLNYYGDKMRVYLQEVPDTDSSWEYDTKMYEVDYGRPTALSLDNENNEATEEEWVKKLYEVNLDYSPKSEVPTTVATFTNIYTAYSGGGGSHTRYYNIKVNGGKALDFLGSEVTRASSGSTIQVQADAAAEGKVFKGWEVVQGGITAGEASDFSFIMPRVDVELTAVYEDTAVKEPDIEEPEDPSEPEQPDEDAEEQKETPVPKTGDSMTMELMLFAVLAAGAAFGMKKAYNKTK